MHVLLRIAFRNLREHTSKSLIIGSLIALGVLIIVPGNSLIDTAERGVHGMFIDNYTGDVFISGVSKTPGATVSLFGVSSTPGSATTPLVPDLDALDGRLRADPRVRGVTGQVTGMGLATIEARRETMSFLFGVDPVTYPELFPDTKLVEGRYLGPGRGRARGVEGVARAGGEEAEGPRQGRRQAYRILPASEARGSRSAR